MTRYASHVAVVPQSEPLAGQVKNSAGGHAWQVDCWTRLDRFLILGCEGGSYYATERQLSKDAAESVRECHQADPSRCINRIVQVSEQGLAPKNDPAIFALAMLSHDPAALKAILKVCRIGTHLFQFAADAQLFRGWGRGLRSAIAAWYEGREPGDLAYQMTKYQNRNGWSHHDLLHKCHAKATSPEQNACFRWAKDGSLSDASPELLSVVAEVQAAESDVKVAELIRKHRLAREVIPTERLNTIEVWDALLDHMPLTAMLRNLGKMSSIGLLKPLSNACGRVVAALGDEAALERARIHPIAVLMALSIYRTGRGLKGSLSWSPDASIIAALDDAFYKSFASVESTGKRHLLALDVSGSMGSGYVGGSFLSPRDASAAMAMVAVRTEPQTHTVGFTGRGGWGGGTALTQLAFTRQQSLADAVARVSGLPFGTTDCALPMQYAMQSGLEVDAFVIYTDSETWCGGEHPAVSLQKYRRKSGIDAKLIVCGMVANKFSIADPNDPGMLDVVGFDASVPQVMRSFVA